jgi:uncharacterized membrane protein
MPKPLTRWLLPASLAINVFLATVLVVHRPSFPPPPPRPHPAEIAARIAATLPPADGEILRQAVAAHADDMERGHHLQHTVPDKVRAVLAAPTLDRAALEAALVEHRLAHQTLDDALAAMITEAATRMSDEGRHKLAQWQPPPPPGAPPGMFGPPGPPPGEGRP